MCLCVSYPPYPVLTLILLTDAHSKIELFSLNMSGTSKPPSSLPWNDLQSPDLSPFIADTATQTHGANTQGYQPVMTLAQNPMHFLGVPGVVAGGVKQKFAFVPDDGSATYPINVERNSTKVLTG